MLYFQIKAFTVFSGTNEGKKVGDKVGLLSSDISSPLLQWDLMGTINPYHHWAVAGPGPGGKIQFYSREGKEGQLLVLLSALSRILGEGSQ